MRTRIIGSEPAVILCSWHLKMSVYAAGKGKMTENVKEMVAANMRNMSLFCCSTSHGDVEVWMSDGRQPVCIALELQLANDGNRHGLHNLHYGDIPQSCTQ